MTLNSLKSRYIISAALLFSLIVLMLTWATLSVRDSSDDSLSNVNNRRLIQLASSQLRDGVWETDFYLNAFLLTPSSKNKGKLIVSIKDLAVNLETLANNQWTHTEERRSLLRQLDHNIQTMHQDITALIDIHEDQEKRFPSLSIIHNNLYPANLEFVTLSSLALEEMPMEHMSSQDADFYRLLAGTQRTWHRMIASFRLFVAYRSETLSNPARGMRNELNDIDMLFSVIKYDLKQLAELKHSGLTSIQTRETVDQMSLIADNWYDNFKVVSQIHTSGEWRKDDVIIREKLQPLSQDIRRLLYKLDNEIDQSIKLEVQSLTYLAESIIERIWMLGIAILFFIVIGYFYLGNRVLAPISNVADGLMIQSQDNKKMQLPNTSTRELNTLVNAFNQLSESLTRAEAVVRHTDKMATVGELASCVAHEINNPLNNMARITEFIEEEITTGNIDDNLSKDFNILHREMDRCAGIVKNLLDFGKPKEPSIQTTSLTPLLDESIQLLKHKAQDKNITLKKRVSADLPEVNADPSQIHQVFVNLLLNAIEFSPSDETITVTAKKNDDQTVICSVIDHGPGADESKIERFFDPFYTTRQGHEGMGLGLSVCSGIIIHHQGAIGASAGKRGGLVVWFTLPIANSPHISPGGKTLS